MLVIRCLVLCAVYTFIGVVFFSLVCEMDAALQVIGALCEVSHVEPFTCLSFSFISAEIMELASGVSLKA